MTELEANATKSRLLNSFAQIAIIEGISMVILLVFSVLKRTTDFSWALLGVKYIGWAHGLLFVAYVYLLGMCWDRFKWKFSRVALYFVASLIPFAPFWVEKQLKPEVN